MPPLWEGDLLYMPTTLPGLSVTEAQRLMQRMDQVLMTVPEVDRVFGKAGRAETSTDPAPFSMMETTILLKPPAQWRHKERWYSNWPRWMQAPFRAIWPDHISKDELIADLNAQMQFPGAANAWTMPIKTRIDMLTHRHPHAGRDQDFRRRPEADRGDRHADRDRSSRTSRASAASTPNARRAASSWISSSSATGWRATGFPSPTPRWSITSAIGGETVTTTVEGRERYGVNVRYARELRDDLPALRRVLVPTPSGAQVPLEELADLRLVQGPGMIRDENGMLAGYVYVDTAESDIGGFVGRIKAVVDREVHPPAGYSLQWSGQYENMLRVKERLKVVVPITLFLIFVLLYMNTKSLFKALLVMLAVPFSAIGAIGLLYLLGYNISIAVWVGLIALMGLDAETGVFMLLFLDLSYHERVRQGKMKSFEDLTEAVVHGAVKRIRPEDDDGLRRDGRPAADHVVGRRRRGHDEARRRAARRRAGHELHPRAARLSGGVHDVEVAVRDAARRQRIVLVLGLVLESTFRTAEDEDEYDGARYPSFRVLCYTHSLRRRIHERFQTNFRPVSDCADRAGRLARLGGLRHAPGGRERGAAPRRRGGPAVHRYGRPASRFRRTRRRRSTCITPFSSTPACTRATGNGAPPSSACRRIPASRTSRSRSASCSAAASRSSGTGPRWASATIR